MLISLDGIVFRGDMSRGMFTVEHSALRGWFESPGVRRADTARPLGDGSFHALTYRAGRSVSWSGLILTKSPSEQLAAMQQLAGMCSDRGLSRLTVQHQGGTSWADVELLQAPEVQVLAYGRVARYDVELFAPDPRRYGDLRTFAGTETVFHRGNAPAFPKIVIPSAGAAYSVTSAGKTIMVAGAPAGGRHVIDTRTGRLTSDGALMTGMVTRADQITLPPGPGQSFTLSPNRSFQIQVQDTFF